MSKYLYSLLRVNDSHPSPIYHVPSLKSIAIKSAAYWSVATLYGLHELSTRKPVADDIIKAIRENITCRIPANCADEFVIQILKGMDIAFEQSSAGRHLLVYIGPFIPKHLKTLVVPYCLEQVQIAAILTLPICSSMTELYMERADQSVITQGLLCHIVKYLRKLRALALPKQCDDSVIAVVGQNCQHLESIVLNDTAVTNTGIAWLLCCRRLTTIIMIKTDVSPAGAALLLHGLPYLSVLLYDSMAETLWYCSIHAAILPKFGVRTVTFSLTDLITPAHFDLLSLVFPDIEWLQLNSGFQYTLQGLGYLPKLTLLSINFRGCTLDTYFEDVLKRNGSTIKCIQLLEVNIDVAKFEKILVLCPNLETIVLFECKFRSGHCSIGGKARYPNVKNVQIIRTTVPLQIVEHLLHILPNLNRFETDTLELEYSKVSKWLKETCTLKMVRCIKWLGVEAALSIRKEFANIDLQLDFSIFKNCDIRIVNSPQVLMAEYGDLAPLLDLTKYAKLDVNHHLS
ncbi:uncharacterized protein LOC136039433 [Artemia franciscana]|uniref:Uncharacterized protein n=1 Tax=Artemia franciscana TaxID=6661 RepID=A0AA88HSQ2_ARTSF|nr:hypothetical protein QYM36_007378 [Artemia franciscana]